MKWLKRIALLLIILIFSVAGCVFYAFKIEPYRIKVNEHTMNEKRKDINNLKIVQISDIHIKDDFTYKNLGKVVNEVNSLDPDIVVFTGDLYDNYAKYNDDENVIAELQKINAKFGKIASWGNRDYGGGAVRKYGTIMERSGFILLKNEHWQVALENGREILFTGLDDSMLGSPEMPDDVKVYDSDYKILLTHEPDAVKYYLGYDYDMILSGHSHGGQVNIPFLPLVNKKAMSATGLASEYNRGMYILKNAAKSSLYVNTGIGTTHISARFGVVPEIAVFYVAP